MRLYFALLAFVMAVCLHAVPAKPGYIYFVQPDGKTVRLVQHSNERANYYLTDDDKVVQQVMGKGMFYVTMKAGQPEISLVLAHNPDERNSEEKKFVKAIRFTLSDVYAAIFPKNQEHIQIKRIGNDKNGLNAYKQSGQGVVNSIGKHRVPVVMAEFSDIHFQPNTTMQKLSRQLNEKGYHDEPLCQGSVRDFFISQSDSIFQPEFVVVAKVKVSKTRNYYGQNRATGGDMNVLEFVKEAIDSAAAQGVDFQQFTESNKTQVPMVAVIFAGQGEADSPDIDEKANYIWPHQWTGIAYNYSGYHIKGTQISVNGYFVGNAERKVRGYNAQGRRISNLVMTGANIFVHEFGHCMGLPDFYATGDNRHDEPTMGYRSQMDVGCYMNDLQTPMAYTAYEKAYLGWTPIRALYSKKEYHLFPYGSDSVRKQSYIVYCPNNHNEYYLLEYRKANKYYPKSMGEGLFVLHVDYDNSAWNGNFVNSIADNMHCLYVPADGERQTYPVSSWDEELYQGDMYPGTTQTDSVILKFKHSDQTIGIYDITLHDTYLSFNYLAPKSSTTTVTGIEKAPVGEAPEVLGIYDLQGHKVSNGMNHVLPAGVYILRTTAGSQKIRI